MSTDLTLLPWFLFTLAFLVLWRSWGQQGEPFLKTTTSTIVALHTNWPVCATWILRRHLPGRIPKWRAPSPTRLPISFLLTSVPVPRILVLEKWSTCVEDSQEADEGFIGRSSCRSSVISMQRSPVYCKSFLISPLALGFQPVQKIFCQGLQLTELLTPQSTGCLRYSGNPGMEWNSGLDGRVEQKTVRVRLAPPCAPWSVFLTEASEKQSTSSNC